MDSTEPLLLDHVYCTLPADAFKELQDFFKPVNSVDSYKVNTGHGQWHGIYAYPVSGGFLEFLEESKRDALGTHGIAFSRHGNEKDLFKELENRMPHTNWNHLERKKEDGSLWYKSSFVENQDRHLFIWGMEYFDNNGKTIRAKGETPHNPILSLKKLEFVLPEIIFDRLTNALAPWAQSYQETPESKVFYIAQKKSTEFILNIKRSEKADSRFKIEIEVSPDFNGDFLKLNTVKAEIDSNILKITYKF